MRGNFLKYNKKSHKKNLCPIGYYELKRRKEEKKKRRNKKIGVKKQDYEESSNCRRGAWHADETINQS